MTATTPPSVGSDRRQQLIADRLRRARERRADGAAASTADAAPRIVRDPDAPIELSSAQRRLWFLQQLDPTSTAYHVPLVHDLDGPLDAARLEHAWRAVVARHEILRTRYESLDGDPRAAVDAEPAPQWRALAGAVDELTERIIGRPFDLAREQPWHAALITTADDDRPERHRLVLVLHHIACDGWSASVLMNDLTTAFRTGQLDPPGVQYADLVRARNQATGHDDVAYWVDHLTGAPLTLELPADRPRPATADPAGAVAHVPIEQATAAALRQLTAATTTTPFMAVLAALHVVLGRWAGAGDIVVGTPVADREQSGHDRPDGCPPDLGGVVGCFANTVALRTTSTPQQTPAQLLDHVRDVVMTGLAHQSVAFERVVDVIAPDRDVSTTPTYQVSLTVHNEPGAELDLPGITTTWIDALAPQAKVDVALHVHGDLVAGMNGGGGTDATVTVVYRTSLFDEATVRRLVGHVGQVLVEMAGRLHRPLGTLRLLTDVEVAGLPAAIGHDAASPLWPTPRAHTVGELVRDVARQHPSRIAVTARGVDLTYAELIDAADRTAAVLAAAGVGRGSLVPLLAERSCDVIVGMLAAWTLGAAYVPLDPAYPDQRIAQIVDATAARVALAQAHLSDRLPAGIAAVGFDDASADGAAAPGVGGAVDSSDVAYVLFTSGTTGTPKGVQVEHGNVLAYLAGLHRMVDIDTDTAWSWALMTTPSADLGLTNVFGALTTGGRLHVLTYEQVTDPEQVAGYFRRHRIDAMKLVPSHLQALWDDAHPTAVLPKHLLILAGEPCPWTLVERIAESDPALAVHNHYGPTETTVSAMGLPIAGAGAARPGASTIAPIGRPFPGTRAHVVDELMRPVPTGVPGELVLAGPTVSRGYLGLPEQTAARFVDEPTFPGAPDTDAGRAYRTGDRVRRLATGEIEFLGRVDDQVKIRGYRVEPGDVAHAVGEHPAVGACTVIVREDRPGVRTLAAYVVPASGELAAVPVAELRDHLRSCLPDYMVPADIVPITAIPLSANGKVERAALPDPDPSMRVSAADRPPSGDAEQRIAAAWCDVLGLESVGATIDFFDAGGDSFSAVKIARALHHDVSVVEVFTHRTVADLAAVIEARAGGSPVAATGLLRRLDQGSASPDVHIVCVPYGGGSPVTFAPLAAEVDTNVAVHGVDLPGHDPSRPDDAPRPITEVASDLVAEVGALDGDVVLYGHCLGGALAVETARQLERAGRPVAGVVAAGTFPAARLPGRLARLWHRLFPSDRWLSNRAYHDMLRSLGGFTDVVDTVDRDFLIRALRHDAREAEDYYTRHYETDDGERRLDAPMLCIVGDRDRATELYEERFAEWEDFADDVDLAVIPDAGHYFLKHQAGELATILDDRITAWRRGDRPRAASPVAAAGRANVSTFLLVAVTQLLSMVGTGLTSFGLGVWVLERTGSVSSFAMISVLALLPAIVLMPVTGALADRVDRRRVMIVADGIAGVATAVLVALLATGNLHLWYVYLFATVGSVANAFQRPAYLAAITQLVPKQYLGQANGLIGLGLNGGDLIAAMLGGMLVGAFGMSAVVGIDVVTFATAFGVLLVVRFPDRLWVRREESFVSEVTGGWRYIVRRRPLVVMVVFFVVFNLLFALPAVLATPLVLAEHGASVLGAVLACGGVGAIAGALAMAVWGGTRRRAVGMVGGTVVLGVGVLVLGSSASPVVQGLGMFVTYGSLLVLNAHWLAIIQTKAGLELQGRVLAINQMLAMSAMPVGFLLSGPLSEWLGRQVDGSRLGDLLPGGDATGPALTILVAGAAIVAWGIAGLFTPSLRRMEDDLPDAIPDGVITGSHDRLQARADADLERHLATRSAS